MFSWINQGLYNCAFFVFIHTKSIRKRRHTRKHHCILFHFLVKKLNPVLLLTFKIKIWQGYPVKNNFCKVLKINLKIMANCKLQNYSKFIVGHVSSEVINYGILAGNAEMQKSYKPHIIRCLMSRFKIVVFVFIWQIKLNSVGGKRFHLSKIPFDL